MRRRSLRNVHIDELLTQAVRSGGGLHLRCDLPPSIRSRDGHPLGEMSTYEALSPLDIQQMTYAILSDEQIRQFEREAEIRSSYTLAHVGTFQVHLIHSPGSIEAEFAAQL